MRRDLTILACVGGMLLACQAPAGGSGTKSPPVPAAGSTTKPASRPAAGSTTKPAPADAAVRPPAAPAEMPVFEGPVIETMDAAGYTYVCIDSGKGNVWAATRKTAVNTGDRVRFPGGMEMRRFHSRKLDRTFPVIYFTGRLQILGDTTAAAPAAEGASCCPVDQPRTGAAAPPAAAAAVAPVPRAKGGLRIAELRARAADLAGTQVVVRGRVVKFTKDVLDRNWLHLRDGSAAGDAGDLTVTTTAKAAPGDVLVVTGKVAMDRDFGHGYRYDILIEDATLAVE